MLGEPTRTDAQRIQSTDLLVSWHDDEPEQVDVVALDVTEDTPPRE